MEATKKAAPSKISHNPEIFEIFLSGPDSFTCFEIHDIEYLANLLNDENIKASDKKCLRGVIGKAMMFEKKQNPNSSKVPVKYYKPKKSGVYNSKSTLQYASQEFKDGIYKLAGYRCLDISCAGYTIIYQVAKVNGIELPKIKEFLRNRKEIYEEYANFGNAKYTAKEQFCCIFSNPIHGEGESEFVKNLIDEIVFVKQLFLHPDFPDFSCEKIIEIYLTAIMKHVADYLVAEKIIKESFYSLNKDAIYFQPLKEFNVEDIEAYILERTQLSINLH